MVGYAARIDGDSAHVSYRLLSPRRAPERFDEDGDGRLAGRELEGYESFFSDRLASAGESHLLRVDGERATIAGAAYEVSSVEYFEPVTIGDPYEDEPERALALSDEPGPTAVPEVHQYELSLPVHAGEASVLELKLPGDYKPYGNHVLQVVDAEVDGIVGASRAEDGSLELDSMVGKTLLVGLRGDDGTVSDPGVALAGRLRAIDADPDTSPAVLEGEALLERLVEADVLAVDVDDVVLTESYRDALAGVEETHRAPDEETVARAADVAERGGASYDRLAEQLLEGERVTETELLALLALDRHGVDDELLLPAAGALRTFN